MQDMQNLLLCAAQALVGEALERGASFGFAESCTAGLCSAAAGSIPGASGALAGSVVSYAIPVKERVLGVSAQVLEDPALGPVSAECAEQMAFGARELLGCDVCVSVTGLAGPGGAEPGKPIGTVWFALCTEDKTCSQLMHFTGNRDEIRMQAACFALDYAREGIVKANNPK